MTYVVHGLDPDLFRPWFGLTDGELAAAGIRRLTVSGKPGFPCRITLQDREVGETVLLLNHVSHDVANPYRASHAIFVAEGATEAAVCVDTVPPVFEQRILSLRSFDISGMMTDAVLAEPGRADAAIRALFANDATETIHTHNAARGCFAAKIERSSR